MRFLLFALIMVPNVLACAEELNASEEPAAIMNARFEVLDAIAVQLSAVKDAEAAKVALPGLDELRKRLEANTQKARQVEEPSAEETAKLRERLNGLYQKLMPEGQRISANATLAQPLNPFLNEIGPWFHVLPFSNAFTRAFDARCLLAKELATTLITIKDEASARTALPELTELKTRLSANTKACRDAGVPPEALQALFKRQFRKEMPCLDEEFRRLFQKHPIPPYVEILTPLKEIGPELQQNPFQRQ